MEKKVKNLTLEEKFAEHLLNILRHEGCLDHMDDDALLERIEVDFEDGVIVEIDINNGNRDDNSSPYLNVNWYKDNKCLYAFDTDPEGELFGTYDFVFEDDENDNEINYILNLGISKKDQTFKR